mgnify:CR=1 FL=1
MVDHARRLEQRIYLGTERDQWLLLRPHCVGPEAVVDLGRVRVGVRVRVRVRVRVGVRVRVRVKVKVRAGIRARVREATVDVEGGGG